MLNRFWRPAVFAVLVLALAAIGGTAVAKSKKAPQKATLQAKGKTTVKRNGFIKDSVHWVPGLVTIRSGGKLTLKNRTDEPHTFSIVAAKDVPKSDKKIFDCGSPGTICDTIFTALAPDPQGNPTKSVVDVGAPGVDQAGDTVVLNPKSNQKVDISAKKGTTLSFICGIHAWMQGKLKVR